MAYRGRHSYARHAAAYAVAGSTAGRMIGNLSVGQRTALVLLAGGPLVCRQSGWCREGSAFVVASHAAIDTLVGLGLVQESALDGRAARLTAHGQMVAGPLIADHADALRLAGEIGRTWLMQRAADAAAQAPAGRVRPTLAAAE